MAGVVPLAIILRWRRSATRDPAALLRALGLFVLPALLLGGLWWGRNIGVYGFPDFLGLRAHDLVVADQPRTADFIAEFGRETYISRALTITFNSFWGQFGWMALPLQDWMYRVFQAVMVAAAGGLVVDAVALRRDGGRARAAYVRRAWLVMGAVMLLALAAYIFYNAEFLQFQGRYLFPALIPLALLLALGLDAWRRWLLPHVRLAQWLPLGVCLLLAALDIYLIWRVIPPALSP
jgi:hypothetical protein